MIMDKCRRERNIVLSEEQVEFRELYKFCFERGLIRDNFKFHRSRKGFTSNIRAFTTIIKKNGLYDEFLKQRATE
jgi:hypothetical protein